MAEITAALVKQLRDDTGLGMMDCKKALEEVGGDIAAAKDALRSKGLATAEKKAGRATKEGLVAIKVSGDNTAGAIVEVQCETDFCARNEEFQTMVHHLADLAFDAEDGEVEASETMTQALQDTLAKIGENMSYARGMKISATRVGSYLHHNGKVGVLVGVDKELDDDLLTDVCMHIAFSDPMGITPDDIPADLIEKEKQFATQEAVDSGKPQDIAEKIVEGKMRKFLEERALMEQLIAREDKYGKKKVKDVLDGAAVMAFARFAVGVD
ncbi:MAG: translation elongation factor Ts [Planctomycetes bacterium]|jgi:elongation factor Ts|nr:translation elongation factor Ts [Planctomycetota bacterium]